MLMKSNQHPFVEGIMEAELPKGFKVPAFMLYDGSTDPIDHINYFNSVMMVYGRSDMASCRFFAASLKGAATYWFSHLRPRSISGFAKLSRAFVTRFQSSIRQKKTVANLLAIKQRKDEYICDFISRFNRESLDIPDMDDSVAFNALQSGITDIELIKSLILNKAHNMTALISQCHQFASMAEIIAAQNEVSGM
ncbi:uncharacterized protein LOC122643486 [Telopea speciosissima]|uniref:uncharacterized protein LOC122643486 n=1 Tax=Telopea speciosissima TaxID=54955 RepID=UPI001CC5384D|nr:uncharacterized protein LOC122643486 [Telopea speciosissima]